MYLLPLPFDALPHTAETEETIRAAMLDHMDYEEYVNHLRDNRILGVFDDKGFCGFYLEYQFDDAVEIHCFIYQSRRDVSIPAMRAILENVNSRGLIFETSVFSSFSYIARFLKMNGFKETKRDVGFATYKGKPVDLIYLSNKREV